MLAVHALPHRDIAHACMHRAAPNPNAHTHLTPLPRHTRTPRSTHSCCCCCCCRTHPRRGHKGSHHEDSLPPGLCGALPKPRAAGGGGQGVAYRARSHRHSPGRDGHARRQHYARQGVCAKVWPQSGPPFSPAQAAHLSGLIAGAPREPGAELLPAHHGRPGALPAGPRAAGGSAVAAFMARCAASAAAQAMMRGAYAGPCLGLLNELGCPSPTAARRLDARTQADGRLKFSKSAEDRTSMSQHGLSR